MKIYTRTGDDGSTALFGGDRVSKADQRLECYGTVDELNACLGLARAAADDQIASAILRVQHDLFMIGSHLATPQDSPCIELLPPLDTSIVARLESEIDAAQAMLPQLRQFILPGGSDPAARMHLARTVCRRAERLVVAFAAGQGVPATIITYLNRLSDWLFVMARLANHIAGVADIIWERQAPPTGT